MRTLFFPLMIFFSSIGHAATQLDVEDCRFPETYAFTKTSCDVTLANTGDDEIKISGFKSTRSGDQISPDNLAIKPHSKAYAKLKIETGNDVGHSRHVFTFVSSEINHEQRTVTARGFVKTVLDDGRPKIDFGVVDLSKEQVNKTVELHSSDVPALRAIAATYVPKIVDVEIASNGKTVVVKAKRNAPWGYWVDYVKLRTNSAVQPEIWIGLQGDFHGHIVPASNPYELGLLRRETKKEQLIRLTNSEHKDFKIGKIELENFKGSADTVICEPFVKGCQMIRLSISDDNILGGILGKIWVELPEYSMRLPITVTGLLVAKNAQIESLDPAKALEQRNQGRSRDPNTAAAIDLKSAITKAVRTAPTSAIPSGTGPLLKWAVTNEETLHGYQIYRSDSEKGPFELITKETIEATEKTAGEQYMYRDNTAESGKTYWYYISLIYNDGRKQQLTGPQKVVAK